MKRSLSIGVLFVAVCLAITSCVTCKQSVQNNVPFNYRVQPETDAIVVCEIHLDGKFVSSYRTMPKEKGESWLKLATTPGDHVLSVTAPGFETWQKTITVIGGTERGPFFLVELKKSEK